MRISLESGQFLDLIINYAFDGLIVRLNRANSSWVGSHLSRNHPRIYEMICWSELTAAVTTNSLS